MGGAGDVSGHSLDGHGKIRVVGVNVADLDAIDQWAPGADEVRGP
jgi:hypothetical protein